MKFNPESKMDQEVEITENTAEEQTSNFEDTEEVASAEIYTELFDDGFGDEMPENISLNSEEDIKAFEERFNIDIESLLQKKKNNAA